jgi:xanthine dehydrogenase YagS FAD-binding subunit
MRPVDYVRTHDVATAVRAVSDPGARFIAGGTNLVDLMRQNVERPDLLVDIGDLPLVEVTEHADGVRIGALARNSHVAADRLIRARYPVLAQALLSGASGQLRNMATVGGNLLQRTRCSYFYDNASPCNKRVPGSGCGALGGFDRGHAVLGTSEHCIATHPSDMCVALAALDAVVVVESVRGVRRIPVTDFHRLPGDTPHVETELASDELITAVEVPPLSFAANSRYRKVRDRASYAFALVSVAAAADVRDGEVVGARLALGGVGTKPWRALEAEQVLVGAPAVDDSFRVAADAALSGAITGGQNGFKVELASRTIVATLRQLAERSA